MLPGIALDIDGDGVAVRSAAPLVVVSSAMVGGGVATVAAIINVHVDKHGPPGASEAALAAFAGRHGIAGPFVGLLTAARTEKAEVGTASRAGLAAMAVVTVGLSNAITAGVSPPAPPMPSTINTIVIVDGVAEPAALVNAVMVVTEVKALALLEAGVKGAHGHPATGTSTDAVAIGVTGRGPRVRFGGPISELGWVVAQAVAPPLRRGIARWQSEHR